MSSSKKVVQRLVAKGVYPYQWAFMLLCPLRNIFLSPRRLCERLAIKEDFHVLEVGAGPGYFSRTIASKLTSGRLTLADIQPEMLDTAKKRLTKSGLTNVDYHLCDGDRFDLPDGGFDVIFLVTVIGEVQNQEAYLCEFHRLLKPGGLLSFSEQAGDPDKLSTKEVRAQAECAGFVFDKQYGSEWNYTINFRNLPESRGVAAEKRREGCNAE
jgi:ubiquinone/menaquinone biosynthesis C-methylase UbiE